MAGTESGKQSTARRDHLQGIEAEIQRKWDEEKLFEVDASSAKDDEKFMATFPYPYMNGLLHIGHAFTLTKAVFASHFNRLMGKKVLFPFGFHCTGMPIQAAANKLKREYEVYGKPYPTFPPGRPIPYEKSKDVIEIDDAGVTLVWKAPACTGGVKVKAYHLMRKIDDGEFVKVAEIEAPDDQTLKENSGKVKAKGPIEGGASVYKVLTLLENGKFAPESKESDIVNVDAAPAPKDNKKGGAPVPGKPRVAKKTAAKTGDAAFQWEILKQMRIEPEEMVKFSDPVYWLHYWPPLGIRDLKKFGSPIDFRRSFITTSVNPYYDAFVRWQFRKLKAADKIGFGKRPTIYSETDGQACMDHDRAEGEGVGPQEYTAIKIELIEFPQALEQLKGKKVYLLAATLRPETMPGQTNCWILPEGLYGCFAAPGNDVYVTSKRAARNMSFQDHLVPWGKPELICEVKGKDLMGCKVKAPTSKYEYVHLLPLLTIKMDKGTGIVTSVPSDSPDDYAAWMDLQKPGKRTHLGVKAEWVEGFEVVPIIDVEIDGEIQHLAAKYMCEKLNVQSQNDKEKLHEAHDTCYKLGFDRGILSAGPMKGKPVKQAKFLFRDVMVKDNQAFVYSEPEKMVSARSDPSVECVVALIDQWYLKYGEESWRKQILDHIDSDKFCTYNDRIRESFHEAIGWLKEWACSRSFGLGTQVPWDEQFVIESLSDSTIYMAYYTIAHMLQGKAGSFEGSLDGSKGSPEGIKPEDLTDDVLDFIYLNGPAPKKTNIPKKVLEKMRAEFRFWYPMDLRVSGKDLIQNHLTMALYNHSCVWEKEPEMWPSGFFTNGWLLVNNEKMSKSKGNFFTLNDIIAKYTADSVRLACANSGDTLEDANFEENVATNALLKMAVLLEGWEKMIVKGDEPLDDGDESARFVDRWFANELNRLNIQSKKYYETMYYREALRTSYFELLDTVDTYRNICRSSNWLPNKKLMLRYVEWQVVIFAPICPHFCDHVWREILRKTGSVLDASWPQPTAAVDDSIVKQGAYIFDKVPHDFGKILEKAVPKTGKPPAATVYIAKEYPEWKMIVLEILRQNQAKGVVYKTADATKQDEKASADWKSVMMQLNQDQRLSSAKKHVGPFAAFMKEEAAREGPSALTATVPFDEVALMKEHLDYMKDRLKILADPKHRIELSVVPAESPADAKHKETAGTAQPAKPSIYFEPGESVAQAAPKAGAPKAKAQAAPEKAPASKPSSSSYVVIKDNAKLNAHLETRSYVDGGAGPSAADREQFAVTESAFVASRDAEKFPHVNRWFNHMKSFAPARRQRW